MPRGTLKGLIAKADARIAEIRSGEKPALTPDANAKYFAEVVVDLDIIDEPMIADPDVNNADVSRRYTHDTIRPISYYGGTKKVDLGFVGSCMVHKGDMKIVAQMLKNIEKAEGKVAFKAPLVVAAPTYNIIDELKAEGDWEILQKYSGFEFDDVKPKTANRTAYENILYLERPGCNLCMGNQGKGGERAIPFWPPRPACSRAASWKTPPRRRVNRSSPRPRSWCCRRSSVARRAPRNTRPPSKAST